MDRDAEWRGAVMAVDPKDFETKDMRIERMERELRVVNAERDALRVIASDYLAESHLIVKPEDAADVATWAANPDAVRELLRHAPLTDEYDVLVCAACTAQAEEAHFRDCAIAAAWRALGDPRGAQDIERAHEEALRHNVTLFPAWDVRRANERQRMVEGRRFRDNAIEATLGMHAWFRLQRGASDVRGMEAVEDEAREMAR